MNYSPEATAVEEKPRRAKRRQLHPLIEEYVSRGWTIIAVPQKKKHPENLPWKRYQNAPPSRDTLLRWLARRNTHGPAVIFGAASDDLVARDFDQMSAYDEWAAAHPELAATLPTVATGKGRHVYARATPENVIAARRAMGKDERNTGAIKLGASGEIRFGVGAYCIVPPAVHPSGSVYRWEIPLPHGEIPLIDLLTCGFIVTHLPDRVYGMVSEAVSLGVGELEGAFQKPRKRLELELEPEIGLTGSVILGPPASWSAEIHAAIASTVPTCRGIRHFQVWELCRALRFEVEELKGVAGVHLKPIVQEWHRRAKPFISNDPKSQSFTPTWREFKDAYPKVLIPRTGGETMTLVFESAVSQPLPEVASLYEGDRQVQELIAVCRELQRQANSKGEDRFWLGCRTVASIWGVSPDTANCWLRDLQEEQIILEVEKGSYKTGKASRFRYLASV